MSPSSCATPVVPVRLPKQPLLALKNWLQCRHLFNAEGLQILELHAKSFEETGLWRPLTFLALGAEECVGPEASDNVTNSHILHGRLLEENVCVDGERGHVHGELALSAPAAVPADDGAVHDPRTGVDRGVAGEP